MKYTILSLWKTQALILAIFVYGILSANAQTAFNLEQLQDSAKANYPIIQQYDLINQATEYTISNANKAYLPQFDINLIGGVITGLPSFTAEAESGTNLNLITVAQLNQVIWDGGITKANKEIIQANANIETAQLDVQMYEIKQKVNDLFFGILLIQEQLKQVALLQENLQTNKKRVQAGFDNGVAFASDLDEIEVEIINAEQKVTELEYTQEAYLSMLALMTQVELNKNSQLNKPQMPLTLSASPINRPELLVFENQRSLIEGQTKINKSMLYPKIGLLGFATFIQPGVDFGPSTVNNIFVGGLSLRWSIGGLYKNSNNKSLVAVNQEKIKVQEQTFLYGLNLEMNKAKNEVTKYQNLLERDNRLIELKTNIKNSYQNKYDNGVATMSDLLNRINDENQANQNKILHEVQWMNAWFTYKTLIGQ